MERAKIVNNKYCAACSIGAVCIVTPTPDFEIAGIAALYGITE